MTMAFLRCPPHIVAVFVKTNWSWLQWIEIKLIQIIGFNCYFFPLWTPLRAIIDVDKVQDVDHWFHTISVWFSSNCLVWYEINEYQNWNLSSAYLKGAGGKLLHLINRHYVPCTPRGSRQSQTVDSLVFHATTTVDNYLTSDQYIVDDWVLVTWQLMIIVERQPGSCERLRFTKLTPMVIHSGTSGVSGFRSIRSVISTTLLLLMTPCHYTK